MAAVLVDPSGMPLAFVGTDDITATMVAGIGFALFDAGNMLAIESGQGDVPKLMVRGENGYIIITVVQVGILLVLSATKDVKLGAIFGRRGGDPPGASPWQTRPKDPDPEGIVRGPYRR
jgi:predicted regulator of Ras-like GTPase activity (Roadblock/LC7/MglB family)